MFGPGYLGTRADCLMDTVVLSLIAIVPLILFSVWKVREQRNYRAHGNIQTGLTVFLTFVLLLFEWDLNQSGGIWELTKESRYAHTGILDFTVYFHLMFSISTAVLWLGLVGFSLVRFGLKNPRPGSFSKVHRWVGKIAVVDMIMTGITGVALYLIGFVY